MNKLQNTAKKLDVFFKVLEIAFSIIAVAMLVFVGVAVAAMFFDLPLDMIGTGWTSLDLDMVKLTLAENLTPEKNQMLTLLAISFATICISSVAVWQAMKCVRKILQPMGKGLPFHKEACTNLKKLAILVIIVGVAVNAMELITWAMTVNVYDLPALLLSTNITAVEVEYNLDLTFLAVAAVFLLLGYVFHYGAELQEQVDETL